MNVAANGVTCGIVQFSAPRKSYKKFKMKRHSGASSSMDDEEARYHRAQALILYRTDMSTMTFEHTMSALKDGSQFSDGFIEFVGHVLKTHFRPYRNFIDGNDLPINDRLDAISKRLGSDHLQKIARFKVFQDAAVLTDETIEVLEAASERVRNVRTKVLLNTIKADIRRYQCEFCSAIGGIPEEQEVIEI